MEHRLISGGLISTRETSRGGTALLASWGLGQVRKKASDLSRV